MSSLTSTTMANSDNATFTGCKCGNNCRELTKEVKKEKINLTIEKAYVNKENNQRIFEAYATYEEIDKQGDLVKADGLNDAIPIWLDRRGTILDSHTNKHIGYGLEYDSVTVKGKPAVWLRAEIFSGRLAHNIDNEAWDKIQSGKYKGLSIGGQTFTKYRECNATQCYNVIPSVQLYEISVVENPANGGAIIIAKENKDKENEDVSTESETVKVEKEKVGNAKLDIFVHTSAIQPAPQDITKQDGTHEGDCECGNHEEVLKYDDFCQCEDSHVNFSKSEDGGSPYVDLFLSLNDKLESLTKEIASLKKEKEEDEDDKKKPPFDKKKTKKQEDEEEDEEDEEEKKKEYNEEDMKAGKKAKKTAKKAEDEEEEEPDKEEKKKGLTKSTTPRPGIVNDKPETSLGNNTNTGKSPLMMEDIIKLTEKNNVNKALQTIDDMVYRHQTDGGS